MITDGSYPVGMMGGWGRSQATAGNWRLSSGQLRTHCLTDKIPWARGESESHLQGCVPGDLEWGGSVLGQTSGNSPGFQHESSELLITTTRSSETEQGRQG